jgi:UDP-glucose 4-epimerase
MTKVLLTGATGQVGRFLVRKFIKEKVDFIGLDITKKTEFKNLDIITPEITNKKEFERYKKQLEGIDVLVHLASKIDVESEVIKSGNTSIDLNLKGTLNLLEYLPNLKHVCYTSTYMVYGTPDYIPVTENHPTNPTTVYGASKLSTEKFLQIFSSQTNVTVTILRMMGIYDLEKPYSQAIPNFVKMICEKKSPMILGSGKIRRNHLHIDDAVDSIFTTLKNPKNGIYNIGGPDAPNNLELIEIINNELGSNIKPIFNESKKKQYDFIVDTSKAKNELEFIPKIAIKEGISRITKSFFKNGW